MSQLLLFPGTIRPKSSGFRAGRNCQVDVVTELRLPGGNYIVFRIQITGTSLSASAGLSSVRIENALQYYFKDAQFRAAPPEALNDLPSNPTALIHGQRIFALGKLGRGCIAEFAFFDGSDWRRDSTMAANHCLTSRDLFLAYRSR